MENKVTLFTPVALPFSTAYMAFFKGYRHRRLRPAAPLALSHPLFSNREGPRGFGRR